MKNKIIILTVVIFFSVGTIAFFFQRLQKTAEVQISDQVVDTQVLLAKTGGNQIKLIFKLARDQLISVAYSFPLQNLLAATKRNNEEQIELWENALTHLFVDVAETHAIFGQLRFIG